MHPKLLPVEVTYLQHAILGKEGVCMVPTLPSCHQARNPLLIPEKGPRKGNITHSLKVPPHHKTVLKVWEHQPIIEREDRVPPQQCYDEATPVRMVLPLRLEHPFVSPKKMRRAFLCGSACDDKNIRHIEFETINVV